MDINRKKCSIILLLLCFCFCFTGCAKNRDEKVEITIIHGWGSTEKDHVVMRQIYEDFQVEHPEIKLNLIAMPSSADVIDKVRDLLTVGEIPDVVFTGGDGRESIYSFMVQEGYAVDLCPYLEADKEFAQNVSEVILRDWTTEEGKLYTVSDVLLMGGYWYNQEVFNRAGISKAPQTWEEWFAACEKIESLEDGTASIILDSEHLAYLMAAMLANESKSEMDYDNDNQNSENSPAFDRMLEQLKKVSAYATLAQDYGYRDTLLAFNQGESAIYINGVWANSMIDSKLQVSYAPFPSEDGNGIGTMSACVGYILGETGDERRIKASIEFLKYMLSEPVAEKILLQTGQLPSNPKMELSEENCSERMMQAVNTIKNAGFMVQTPENLWDLSDKEMFGENVILFLKDKITKEELQKRLFEQ